MTRPRDAHLIFTTHWDREWIQTFEQYRFRLVNLFDNLLDILAREPDIRFVFDGQTIVLEDYLEVRPENKDTVKRLAEEKRLVFGPWYILADQFLEGPEATVRNLFLGRRIASEFGGAMEEGYVPDSFGSLATLPVILNGFGIRFANFGRGVAGIDAAKNALFHWAWKDGSRVLALAKGYGNAIQLTFPDIWRDIDRVTPNVKEAPAIAREIVEREAATLPTDALFLVAGVDHMEMRPGMSEILRAINEGQDAAHFRISDPQQYMEAAEREVADRGLPLQTVVGEMRGDAAHPMDLQGVLSTHREMKRKNRACERAIEGHLEPLDVLQHALTDRGLSHFVDHAWKLVLRNHPHDSICASSLDEVIADIMARFDWVDQLHAVTTERALRNIAPGPKDGTGEAAVLLLNTVPYRGVDGFEALVRVPRQLEGDAWRLTNADGVMVGEARRVAARSNDLETHYATNAGLAKLACKAPAPDRDPSHIYTLVEVRGVLDFGDAAGFQKLSLQPAKEEALRDGQLMGTDHSIENDFVALQVMDDGALRLHDKSSGAAWEGLCTFEDDADLGNTYDYLPLDGDTPLGSTLMGSRLVSRDAFAVSLEVTHALQIPSASTESGRSADMLEHAITTTYTLRPGQAQVSARVAFTNQSINHRLRLAMRFRKTDRVTSGGHFAAHERPWEQGGGQFACRPMLDYLHISNGSAGLALLGKGLYEFEPRAGDEGACVYVTLLRSTDEIGPGAGCNYRVEHAKELGEHAAEFALTPAGTPTEAAQRAAAYTVPVLGEAFLHNNEPLPPAEVLSYGVPKVVHSCFKRAEARDGVVVRFYNPSAEAVPVTVHYALPYGQAHRVRLDETPMESAITECANGGITLTAQPYEVVTLKYTDA